MTKTIACTSNTCPYCIMTKNYLERKGVDIEEGNVQTDVAARSELMGKGYTDVPVIVIGDEEIVSFNKAKLKKTLDK